MVVLPPEDCSGDGGSCSLAASWAGMTTEVEADEESPLLLQVTTTDPAPQCSRGPLGRDDGAGLTGRGTLCSRGGVPPPACESSELRLMVGPAASTLLLVGTIVVGGAAPCKR